MKQQQIVICAIIVILVGVAAFFAGFQYSKSSRPAFGQGQYGQFRQRLGGQNGGGLNGMRPVRGQIVTVNGQSLTVKMSDGSSTIVLLDSKTKYMQFSTASISDIKTGKTVNVLGTKNSDGSITAQNIQLTQM